MLTSLIYVMLFLFIGLATSQTYDCLYIYIERERDKEIILRINSK